MCRENGLVGSQNLDKSFAYYFCPRHTKYNKLLPFNKLGAYRFNNTEPTLALPQFAYSQEDCAIMHPQSVSDDGSGRSAPDRRNKRVTFAALACENCRARKHRCDEQRPKCGLCKRTKLECSYREPKE
ncbi:hypothetical protein F5884DRAFT_779627 [Xylogone sp. PMI_703]|nr:hypothetical protein F5884DRAFT_779627 [Xylogone sp. PMI_703]